jgi:RNA polymerase sigma-70 factor (ECF subfamily)
LVEEAGRSGKLDGYYLFHAARADLLRRLNRRSEAVDAYSVALSLTSNRVEQSFIHRRLQELSETNESRVM